jgi:hypothetical protein
MMSMSLWVKIVGACSMKGSSSKILWRSAVSVAPSTSGSGLPDLPGLCVAAVQPSAGPKRLEYANGLHLVVALVVALELGRPFQNRDLGTGAPPARSLGDDGGVEARH